MALSKRILLLAIGAAAIAGGLCLYAVLRPSRILLIPAGLHVPSGSWQASRVLLGALPSAIHSFALPVLTLACVRTVNRSAIAMACLGWCAVDVFFELAQQDRPASLPYALLPGGTFDGLDVLAVLLGATLAGAVGVAVSRGAS